MRTPCWATLTRKMALPVPMTGNVHSCTDTALAGLPSQAACKLICAGKHKQERLHDRVCLHGEHDGRVLPNAAIEGLMSTSMQRCPEVKCREQGMPQAACIRGKHQLPAARL